MAVSLRIGCTGNDHSFAKFAINNNCCRLRGGAPWPMSVMFVGDQSRSRGQNRRTTAVAAMTTVPVMAATGWRENSLSVDMEPRGTGDRAEGKDAVDASDRLDRWMRDSVVEIVENLREAPLLVQVFPKGDIDGVNGTGGYITTTTTKAKLVTEKRAMEENWPAAREKWRLGKTPSPEGLILVEELTGDVQTENEKTKGREKTTKVWGVVVQGRRAECGPVCYLLKTTRVGAGPMGPYCTHFCLTRVKNFMESVESQFKNVWRVQSQNQ